jgi:hypothetical protein
MIVLPGLPTTAIDFGNPVNAGSPLNRGLAGWWVSTAGVAARSGGRLLDICGKNHATFVNGAAWSSGAGLPGGAAVLFDGNDDRAEIGDVAPSDIAPGTQSEFAVSALFCAHTGGGFHKAIVAVGDESSNHWKLYLNGSTTKIAFTGAATIDVQADATYTTGVWYHALVTRDATSTKLFVNGVMQADTEAADNISIAGTEPLWFGGTSVNTAFRYFAGRIASVRIYLGRSFTAGEAAALNLEDSRGAPTTLNRVRLPVIFSTGGGGNTPISASDALILSIADAYSLIVALASSDDQAIGIADTAAVQVAFTAIDALGLSVGELVALLSELQRVDTLGLTLDDVAAILVALAAVDDPSLTLADLAAITIPLTAADVLLIALADASTLNTNLLGDRLTGLIANYRRLRGSLSITPQLSGTLTAYRL